MKFTNCSFTSEWSVTKIYKKKFLATVIVGLLTASMTMALTPFAAASPDDWIAVYPAYYEGTTIGEEFTIDINISVANLAGFEYKFRWNNTLLEVTKIQITPPWATYFIGSNVTSDLGDGRNQHFLGVASLPTTGWTGETTICTYTFRVIYKPHFPEPDGYSLLDLVDTKFSDPSATPIPHETYDGEYTIKTEIAHDVAVISVVTNTTEVYVGDFVGINVTAKNVGGGIETFNVTAYYDNKVIGTGTVTDLAPGENTTLTFNWKAQVLPGNYTIKAVADTVPDETDTADNTFIDGEIKVMGIGGLTGDANGDGIVDINDLVIWGSAFGSRPGYPSWNPLADCVPDDLIDIFDAAIIAANYGKTS